MNMTVLFPAVTTAATVGLGCGKLEEKAGVLPILCAGLTYGFTPCAPLLLMIGYSFTLPVPLAGATGIAFSLASMASPVLLLTVITGGAVQKDAPGDSRMYQMVPAWVLSAVDGDAVYYHNLAPIWFLSCCKSGSVIHCGIP